jgi:hypothetical protein
LVQVIMTRAILACAIALAAAAPAAALPLSTLENSYAYLARTARQCMRHVPSAADPIRDGALFAQMHRDGTLVDSFRCGRCRYDLAADADAVFYVRTCR